MDTYIHIENSHIITQLCTQVSTPRRTDSFLKLLSRITSGVSIERVAVAHMKPESTREEEHCGDSRTIGTAVLSEPMSATGVANQVSSGNCTSPVLVM